MGFYVHLSVIMPFYKNEPVAEIAKKHVKDMITCNEAKWFLEELSERKGINPGPKGGLSLWGIVGNYTSPEVFVEILRPFWVELFETEVGPSNHEHIIVFYEAEQSERAYAYEISYNEEKKQLNIEHHALPFAWMQY